jgi:hypothetical protein
VLGFEQSAEFLQDVTQELYQRFLHRAADPTALTNVSNALVASTPEQQAATIIGSAEYFTSRGNGTATGFLTALYSDILNRAIDSAALARFSSRNLTDSTVRAQVAAEVFASSEYQTDLVNFPQHVAQNYNSGFAVGFYQTYLHRAADATGLAAAQAQFKAGQTDFQVMQTILASDEYFTNL